MKKVVSSLLCAILLLGTFVPMAMAEASATEELLGDTFVRITLEGEMQNFAANTPKEFTLTVPEAGNYTLFLNKNDLAETPFAATFTQGEHTAAIGALNATPSSFKYNYIRVGAAGGAQDESVYLNQGAYTLTLTAAAASQVTYMDLRGTDIEIDGTKQGIYPSDYTGYKIGSANHVNGELSTGAALAEGYTYFNAYPNKANTRQIHVDAGRTVNYTLNVTKGQNYRVKLSTQSFVWTAAAEEKPRNVYYTVLLDGTQVYRSPDEALTINKGSNSGVNQTLDLGVIPLSEGTHTLTIKPPSGGLYVKNMIIEGTSEAVVADATVLPKTLTAFDFGTESATIAEGVITMNTGDSVTVPVRVAENNGLDFYVTQANITEDFSLSYRIDNGEVKTAAKEGIGKLFDNETLSAGEHTITVIANSDNVQIKNFMLTAHTESLQDNTVLVSNGRTVTPVDLGYATYLGWASFDPVKNTITLLENGSVTFTFAITEEAFYTLYANAKMPQASFAVLADGIDVTNVMYQETTNATTVSLALNNVMDKKLTEGLVQFAPGSHTMTVQNVSDTEILLNSFELRRADGVVKNDPEVETVIPSWDFNASSGVNKGWYFPHQYFQSNAEKVQATNLGIYQNVRDVIVNDPAKYTYIVNVEEEGFYDFGAYFTSDNQFAKFNFSVDGGIAYRASGTPAGELCKAVNEEGMYLNRGIHEIIVSRNSETTAGAVVRMFGVYFKKQNTDAAVITPESVTVTANYAEAVSGVAIASVYKNGKLVSVGTKNVENEKSVTVEVFGATDITSASVFVFESLTSLKPVAEKRDIDSVTVKKIALYLMGDSVCANYGEGSFPWQGWGYYIGDHFNDDIRVVNKAVGGASTKTYMTGGYWEPVYKALSKGDFVFINFGLNDFYDISETGKGTTIDEYKENLAFYCEKIREKGATPILISTIPEAKTTYGALQERATAVGEVAQELGVTFLDLNTYLNDLWLFENGAYSQAKTNASYDTYYLSAAAFDRIEKETGKTVSQSMRDYIATTPDKTHVNIDGATFIAKSIVDLMKETDTALLNYLK